jgi:transcriptional regulator GlxA family with amidase domain
MSERVLLVVHHGTLGMELFGARDIFEMANWHAALHDRPAPFEITIATSDGKPVSLWGGAEIGPVQNLHEVSWDIDDLVVVGGPIADRVAMSADELVSGVERVAKRSRRVLGLCTGAFVLGSASLLDGRRCTTHWGWCEQLATEFPLAKVQAEAMFVRDEWLWTSAGVTAAYDLLLALLQEDIGAEPARWVAHRLVLYLRRTGTQLQFGDDLFTRNTSEPIRRVQEFVAMHLTEPLPLATLADQAGMSERHLARTFRTELGITPGRYVERARLEAAKRLLGDSGMSTESIAAATGFRNYRALHRAFALSTGVPPAEYRRRFGSIPEAPQAN